MRTHRERLGAAAVALTLLAGGGFGMTATQAAAAPALALAGAGAGIDAPFLYRMQGADILAQADDGTASEAEAATETGADGVGETENEVETGGDQAIDGIDCVQEGEHEGENEGC